MKKIRLKKEQLGSGTTFPIPFKKLKSESDQDSEISPDEKAEHDRKHGESQ